MENMLKEIRKSKSMTLDQVGNIFGVDKSQISKLEKGTTKLHSEWIKKFCDLYEVSPNHIFGYKASVNETNVPDPVNVLELYKGIQEKFSHYNTQKLNNMFIRAYKYLCKNPDAGTEMVDVYLDALEEIESSGLSNTN